MSSDTRKTTRCGTMIPKSPILFPDRSRSRIPLTIFGNIALTEYAACRNAACRNAASVMSEALFIHEMQEATNRMTECCKEVTHYLHNRELKTPRVLAHIVCQNAWLIMVELTKLYGHAVGSRECEVKMRDGTGPRNATWRFSHEERQHLPDLGHPRSHCRTDQYLAQIH